MVIEEYGNSMAKRNKARLPVKTGQSLQAANEASANREKELRERLPGDLLRAAAVAAAIAAFVKDEFGAY